MHRDVVKPCLLALVAALALGGCGSSKSSSSAGSITKAQFVAKGNAICAAGNASRKRRANALGNNPTRAQIISYVKKIFVPNIQQQIDGLRGLGASHGDQAKVTGMLDLAQADLDKVKAKPILVAQGPGLFQNFATEAHAYGLTQCAKNA